MTFVADSATICIKMCPIHANFVSTKTDNILLVGCVNGAVSNLGRLSRGGCRQCESITEATALAGEQQFDTVFVVIAGLAESPADALQTLRRTCGDAKIILLAQMYEEPQARLMVRSLRKTNGGGFADDYFICPVTIERTTPETASTIKAVPIAEPAPPPKTDIRDVRIKELEKLAMEDDLTGLKNRRYIREFLRQIIGRSKSEDLRVTLLVFDIDDFKHYNDSYGHTVGDNVLKHTGVMMRHCCRSHDVIGRIGGDEFAVIFWDCTAAGNKPKKTDVSQSERRQTEAEHPREAFFIAERFRKQISSAGHPFLGHKGKGVLTISGGLASFPHDGKNVAELFEQADKAMLEAKQSGKNQIYLVGKDTTGG